MRIETERLMLRPWADSDAAACFRAASDPDVGPRAGWAPHKSEEESLSVIRGVLSVKETYAVTVKGEDVAMGSASIMETEPPEAGVGEIGYWIAKELWGKGYIPEAVSALQRRAFTELNLNALICGYFEGNEQSRRVQEKCGFTYWRSVENKPVPALGRSVTEHYTRITREEWQKMQEGKHK